jgi:hypothetical protein
MWLEIWHENKRNKIIDSMERQHLWNARGERTERKLHRMSYSLSGRSCSQISHCSPTVRGKNNPRGTKDWGWKLALFKKTGCSKDKSNLEWHKLFQSSIQINFGNFCNFLKAWYTKLLAVTTKFNPLPIDSCYFQGFSDNSGGVVSKCKTAVKDIKVRHHIKV